MKTRTKLVSIVALAAVALIAAGSLEARPGRKDPERRLQKMKRHLGLSNDQVAKIRAIHKKYMPKHKELRTQIRAKRKEIRALVIADTASRDALRTKLKEASDLKVEMRLLWFDQHREVREVLTPAQRAKLRKHMESRKGKGRRGKGRRGRRGCD